MNIFAYYSLAAAYGVNLIAVQQPVRIIIAIGGFILSLAVVQGKYIIQSNYRSITAV